MQGSDRPFWVPVARRLSTVGVAFCAVAYDYADEPERPLPFSIAPEHLGLPHWQPINDPQFNEGGPAAA